MTIDPERRRALVGLKLAALVRDHAGDAPIAASPFAGGAALTRSGEGWVLADDRPQRILGPSLVWASRQPGVGKLHVLCDDEAGVVARRAALFAADLQVWAVDGRVLRHAQAAAIASTAVVDADMMTFAADIEAAGAEPLCEWGALIGEVRGLEVCRVIRSTETGVAMLAVGVGAHDREAFAMIHGDRPPVEALAGVIEAVGPHRRLGAAPHALNRLAAERMLRAELIDDPAIVGASVLLAAEPPVARPNLKDPVPCVATGFDAAGQSVTVVCSVGIDVDLVPFAADAHLRHGGRLIIAVPERDAHPIAHQLIAQLRTPAHLVTVRS
jgi:hypothetical protein